MSKYCINFVVEMQHTICTMYFQKLNQDLEFIFNLVNLPVDVQFLMLRYMYICKCGISDINYKKNTELISNFLSTM